MTTRFHTRSRRFAVMSAVLVMTATGCADGGDENTQAAGHHVIYEVTGSENVTWIKYIADGSTTTQLNDVALPWRKEFSLPAEGPGRLSLLVLRGGEAAVSASITVNGHMLTGSRSSGPPGDNPMRLTGQL